MKKEIQSLTVKEKLRLLCGKTIFHTEDLDGKLKSAFLSDGPCGVRLDRGAYDGDIHATMTPSPALIANTWNRELARLDGYVIGDECVEKGVDQLLAPGVNIKRTPLCGRNFEYFSEDPYLSGTMAKEFIDGIQQTGVGACVKHYCANNREFDRLYISSEVDERTLREIYLRPFEIALQAKPWMLMSSYNPVNGVYMSENKWLLQDILREEFAFDGVVVSDWGAVPDYAKAVAAGTDLIMPYSEKCLPALEQAYKEGTLTDEAIDAAVERLLAFVQKTTGEKRVSMTKEERHQATVKIAEEGIVLLKNEGALPVRSGKTFVYYPPNPILCGSGSAETATAYVQEDLTNLLNGIAQAEKLPAVFERTRAFISSHRQMAYYGITDLYERGYEYDAVVLTVYGRQETETEDREKIRLPQGVEEIILETAKHNDNVIVALISGSAVDMSRWIDKVNAVIYCGYAGEGGTEALANVLTGKVCPSGKLAETFPLCLEDTYTGSSLGEGSVERYTDGIFVGYRHYDKMEKEVLFPFGHGLSYAKFSYANLSVEKQGDQYVVSYDVTNESDIDAKETTQVYVKDVFAMVSREEKSLQGYSKDLIKAGETKRISVTLDERAFAYYSLPNKRWHIEDGYFEILVGASSRDIRLRAKLNVESGMPQNSRHR